MFREPDVGAKIINGIYIGSLETAKLIDEQSNPHNIGVIINLSGVMYDTNIPALYILMEDQTVTEDLLGEYLWKFSIGMKLIKKYRDQGKNVLVHCAAGINRSATLIAFYLLSQGFTYYQTLNFISAANKKRNVPYLTNRSFRYMLRNYELVKALGMI